MADIKEVHGLVAAKVGYTNSEEQQVRVVDQEDGVRIVFSQKDYAARLTPDEARRLAALLAEAADRVEE